MMGWGKKRRRCEADKLVKVLYFGLEDRRPNYFYFDIMTLITLLANHVLDYATLLCLT